MRTSYNVAVLILDPLCDDIRNSYRTVTQPTDQKPNTEGYRNRLRNVTGATPQTFYAGGSSLLGVKRISDSWEVDTDAATVFGCSFSRQRLDHQVSKWIGLRLFITVAHYSDHQTTDNAAWYFGNSTPNSTRRLDRIPSENWMWGTSAWTFSLLGTLPPVTNT